MSSTKVDDSGTGFWELLFFGSESGHYWISNGPWDQLLGIDRLPPVQLKHKQFDRDDHVVGKILGTFHLHNKGWLFGRGSLKGCC